MSILLFSIIRRWHDFQVYIYVKYQTSSTNLDSSFGELRLTGQSFSCSDARVVRFLEFTFKFSQLARTECRTIPAEFPLLMVMSRVRMLLLQQLRLRRLMSRGERSPAGKMCGRWRWCHAVCPNGRIFSASVGRVLTQRTATTTSTAAETTTSAFARATTAAATMTTVGRIYSMLKDTICYTRPKELSVGL